MNEKRNLLAKATMDASKIIFVTSFGSLLLSSNPPIGINIFIAIVATIMLGLIAWIVQPSNKRRRVD